MLRDRGFGVREIARRLDRSASTDSRELLRHFRPHDRGVYDGDLAHARAHERLRRPRRPLLAREPELRQIVQDKLTEEWSPAQIAGHLRETYPDRPARYLCDETIYQALYHGDKGGLSRTLTKRLRTGRRAQAPSQPDTRAPRFIAPGQPIHHRPAVVEQRTRIGDWAGDLIVGRASRSAIGTLVGRRTGYLRLVHLPAGRSAEQVRVAMLPVLARMPALARQTLTWDQGSLEMAYHHLLDDYFADGISFAPPASPWLRETNEHTNGLLRQHFPRAVTNARSAQPICRRSRTASTAALASDCHGELQRTSWMPN
jgi:IS30 family transposase